MLAFLLLFSSQHRKKDAIISDGVFSLKTGITAQDAVLRASFLTPAAGTVSFRIATICKDAFFYETIRLSSVANSWSGSIGFDRCAFNPACMLR